MKNLVLIICFIPSLFYSQITSKTKSSNTETISFISDGGLIIFKGKINGIDANIMWDNGFSVSGINEILATDLKLSKLDTKIDGTNFNGKIIPLNQFFAKSLQIGDKTVSNVKLLSVDLNFPTTLKIDAVLGADIINQFYWDFNFDENEITISKKLINKEFTQKIPFIINEKSNHHYINIEIEGNKSDALIDFGSNSENIDMKSDVATALFNKKNIPFITIEGIGAIGIGDTPENITTYLLKNNYDLTLGQTKIKNKQTPLVSITNNLFYHTVIGNEIFRKFGNLIIDPFNKTYTIYPSKKIPKPYTFSNFGIAIASIQNMLTIIMTIKESQNVKTHHFSAGDIIKSIDGNTSKFFKNQNELTDYLNKDQITIVTNDNKVIILNKEVLL